MFYGSAEALFWRIQNSQIPPLLVASPTPQPAAGVAPGTQLLFGNTDVASQDRFGGRFTLGWWADPCQTWGIEGSYFFLASRGQDFTANSTPANNLARPFFNVNPAAGGTPARPVPDFEPLGTGSFRASTSNELWGADIDGRFNLWRGCQWRFDGLAGFRYLRFDEQLAINESFAGTFLLPGVGVQTVTGSLVDSFKTTNDFYGGQLGFISSWHRGCWSLDLTAKVALGDTHETVDRFGQQTALVNGVPIARPFGLLVQPSNFGSRSQDVFAVVPEVGLNLGYQLTPHLKIFGGYDFLYWSKVARVGDQVDPVLNVNSRTFPISQPVGATQPAPVLRDTSFWAQGFNVGLQFSW
jgi:hypothetical protein